jgi:acyl transferase domain-containing protein
VSHDNDISGDRSLDIAVIGMSARFPGAQGVEEFWQNLCAGRESITVLSEEDLRRADVDVALRMHPDYVRALPEIGDPGLFDAAFFDMSSKEARCTDPQHRLFLECAWSALEDAGYDAQRYAGLIGVYGGSSMNTYLLWNGCPLDLATEQLAIAIGNEKDYLTTRVSYKLNLKGPSVTVQTACSTSLVAVHLACQSLLNQECDMALAGGVSVRLPHNTGYLYQDGDIRSPDGHCRAFDAKAQGTIFGSGVGIVVLKRLADALEPPSAIRSRSRRSRMRFGFTPPARVSVPWAR